MQPIKVSQPKWTINDFVTLAIFNGVMIILMIGITLIAMVALTPAGAYLAGAGVIALFNGSVYMVMANKIGKRGVLFFTSLITGLFFLMIGQVYYLVTLVILGSICELLMGGTDTYKRTLRNAIGYAAFYISYSLCGVLPLVFFRKQYLAIMEKSYSPEQLAIMLRYYDTPEMVVLMCAISTAGAVAGCLIGSLFLKKHVKRAKLI